MRFLPGIAVLLSLLASPHARAARDLRFALAPDSSRILAQVIFWQELRDFGSDYSCEFRVRRPEPGEKPLADPRNRFDCRFTHPDGSRATTGRDLGNSPVEAAGKPGDRFPFFTVDGLFPLALTMQLSEFYERRGGAPVPGGLLQSEARCEADGRCNRLYTLNTKQLTQISANPVEQLFCIETSVPANQPGRRPTETGAALFSQIHRQLQKEERVRLFSRCLFAPIQSAPVSSAPGPATKPLDGTKSGATFGAAPDIRFEPSELREITFSWPREWAKHPMQRFAFDFARSEQDLKPFLSRTLSGDGYRYMEAFVTKRYQADDRMAFAYIAAQNLLEPFFYGLFKDRREALLMLMQELALIPDPDRWFLISALASFEWVPLPSKEFLQKVPAHWRPLGNRLVSRRVGRVIYVNRGFWESDAYDPEQRESLDNWMLWEAVKSYLPAGDVDFARFGERFSRSLTAGHFNEFRVKDAQGRAALTYLDTVERLARDVRRVSQWPWNPENGSYLYEGPSSGPPPLPMTVRFQAPYLLEAIGGAPLTDTAALQFERASPGDLDSPNRASAFELALFCDGLAARGFPAQVRITPRRGVLLLDGTAGEWKGVEDLRPFTVPISRASECASRLTAALIEAHQDYKKTGL